MFSSLARRLDAAGLPRRGFERSPPTWPIVAAVLAERLGHPNDVIQGEHDSWLIAGFTTARRPYSSPL